MQKKNKFQLILGSQSPRRKELLQWTFIPFKIVTSDIEEVSDKTDVAELVQDLAYQKAKHVYDKVISEYHNPVVLGADTIVVLGDEVLGKPKDREEAQNTLLKLMGKSHDVLTGVCLFHQGGVETFYDKTKVYFDEISDELLELYLDTGESMDKAGSYGIQGAALGFIGRLEGSYSNVVGLPVNLVLKKIKSVLELNEKNWRSQFEA
jgi:septum formation protein